jgi:hypothetical protein
MDPAMALRHHQSPAVALRNLGLSPKSLMASISQMNRMTPDFIPLLSLLPPENRISQPLREFSKFPELPVELRLKIWEHVCFLGRDIDLIIATLGELEATTGALKCYEFISSNSYPAILITCKQSRAVAMMHYRLSFGTFHKYDNIRVSTPSSIYVNWECDRICLMWPDDFKSHIDPAIAAAAFIKICSDNKLRHIALNALQGAHWSYVDFTTKIPSLREVLLFGVSEADAYAGIRWGFGLINMETFAAEYPDSWKDYRSQAWTSQLVGHRRDLTTFFELNGYKIQEGPATLNSVGLWQPPRIEFGYIIEAGVPVSSAWDQ